MFAWYGRGSYNLGGSFLEKYMREWEENSDLGIDVIRTLRTTTSKDGV